ncbi:MAG: MFS transporter [Zoogloeaceae bacterium]|nr:MFS transporter [Zoogloeaceae bacterium]
MTAEPVLPAESVQPVRRVLAYGALGLPLAFAALPIYVHAPKLYAGDLGLSLAAVGGVLLLARVLDAVTDPLIGALSDRYADRRLLILLALPLLAFGMLALLAPPSEAGAGWLAGAVIAVTLGYSLATINYNAWGAEAARDPSDRTRLVAAREGCALVGVVLAAALPTVLAEDGATGLERLLWVFAPVLAACAALTLLAAPRPSVQSNHNGTMLRELAAALRHRPFAALLLVFAASGIAAAIPASTVLFFVADVLGAERWSGVFLVLYFLAGAAGLPLWVRIASHIGKLHAWLVAMLLSVVVFAWAASLGGGDLLAYGLICVLSGFALGADLALPPAMLADLLARDFGRGPARAGAWFGWWNFVTKANLAIAAGLSLPLLGWLGYAPGEGQGDALFALALVYAGLPCIAKLGAAALLWRLRHQLDFEGRSA